MHQHSFSTFPYTCRLTRHPNGQVTEALEPKHRVGDAIYTTHTRIPSGISETTGPFPRPFEWTVVMQFVCTPSSPPVGVVVKAYRSRLAPR